MYLKHAFCLHSSGHPINRVYKKNIMMRNKSQYCNILKVEGLLLILLWVRKLLKISVLIQNTMLRAASATETLRVKNVTRSWGIEGSLSPISPENLTEWLGYAVPLTKINYISWKMFQHFPPFLPPLTCLPFFIYIFLDFRHFLACVHWCAMGSSAAKRSAHGTAVLYHKTCVDSK